MITFIELKLWLVDQLLSSFSVMFLFRFNENSHARPKGKMAIESYVWDTLLLFLFHLCTSEHFIWIGINLASLLLFFFSPDRSSLWSFIILTIICILVIASIQLWTKTSIQLFTIIILTIIFFFLSNVAVDRYFWGLWGCLVNSKVSGGWDAFS